MKIPIIVAIHFLPWLVSAQESSPVHNARTRGLDPDIQRIIRERVDNGPATAMAVGLIDEKGVRKYTYGTLSKEGGRKADEHTLFEIGSISKTFTALLLATQIEQGKAELDDPIEKYVPITVQVPEKNGKKITLKHLVTHTSGLPRRPTNLRPESYNKMFENYTSLDMYFFLNNYELSHNPGANNMYSNYAMGLLGHILGEIGQEKFDVLLKKEILDKLGMTSTWLKVPDKEAGNKSSPYSRVGKQMPDWDLPALAAAGAIKSSLHDMLRYLSANMQPEDTLLKSAIELTHVKRRLFAERKKFKIWLGMNWIIKETPDGKRVIWHNGRTAGFSSYIGFCEETKKGVVVLSNAAVSNSDIGIHVLNPDKPLKKTSSFWNRQFLSHNKIGLDLGFSVKNKVMPSAVLFYNRYWGPFDLLQIKPFFGYSSFEVNDFLDSSFGEQSVQFYLAESGLYLDLGNIFKYLLPNTFLGNLTIQPGFKINCLVKAKTVGTGGKTDLTSEFPMISIQTVSRYGYNLGRFALYVEFGDSFNHLDKNKKYDHFGTESDGLTSKVVLSAYF